jgi:hypothetical protein
MKRGTAALALMLMLFVGWYAGNHEHQARADAPLVIPQSWGTCVGAIGNDLIFVEPEGTVRIVSGVTGKLFKIFQRKQK